ncbi:uncharacterized protein LOC111107672 isoform X1 [Crassostrea virginica]|uniref:Uncharacterized protein LOC111107672 isoform X1 n=2 Tax=Crassostrea virginica TaxID=6565 RepID=A0A8B8B7K1_CRAVI|nr:uncharacterized protein LOC111107672 isoform X1 [Crassostrea virginica]XP_022298687.1 uncharacterized protein LOC111107672 isoform X1 [Crassostrea virginica]XP_022298688.1 uncharacterized protein LOC111107672 isoform X1 [Crassostrea virginica]XP_022298689.1 uncharacterized protein LOC111107672 isoform X1 [Crassostrea virginica]
MEPHPPLLYPLILLISSLLSVTSTAVGSNEMFMDSYGTCQQTSFFHVPEEGYLVHAKGSGQIYQTLRCSLRFRTQVDKQLCVKFNSFRIDDCSVHFKVFQENQPVNFGRQPSEDCLYRHYGCQDSPQTVCSTDSYLTLQLHKERIDAQGYSLQLTVEPKAIQTVFSDEIIMSLWFIVGVIVAVVVVIVVLAVVIVICCRKDRHHGRVFKQKKNKPRSGGQGRLLEAGPEPSAPPLDPGLEMHQHIVTSYGQFPNEPPPPYEPKPEPV